MADLVLLGPQRVDVPAFRWRTRLDGAFYGFRLFWVSRAGREYGYTGQAGRWMLDIRDTAGNAIALGIGVVVDLDMLAPVPGTSKPPGQLFVRDDSGRGRLPTRNGWRGDFRLIYRPKDDVAAAAGTDAAIR